MRYFRQTHTSISTDTQCASRPVCLSFDPQLPPPRVLSVSHSRYWRHTDVLLSRIPVRQCLEPVWATPAVQHRPYKHGPELCHGGPAVCPVRACLFVLMAHLAGTLRMLPQARVWNISPTGAHISAGGYADSSTESVQSTGNSSGLTIHSSRCLSSLSLLRHVSGCRESTAPGCRYCAAFTCGYLIAALT